MEMNPVELLFIERNPENLKHYFEVFKESKFPNHIRFVGGAEEAVKVIFQLDEFHDWPKPDIIISDFPTYRKEVKVGILDLIVKGETTKCIPTVILSSLDEEQKLEIHNCPNLLLPKPKTIEEYRNVAESIEKFWLTVHKE